MRISTLLALFALLVLPASAQVVVDGIVSPGEGYVLLDDDEGGPDSGFGDQYLNAIYATNTDGGATLNFFGAGKLLSGNRVVVFVDSRAGGYTDGSFGRQDAPPGIANFNSGTTFDSGFAPDFAFVIGTNQGETDYTLDAYTLSGDVSDPNTGGPNTFAGTTSTNPGFAVTPATSETDDVRGFEIAIPASLVGYTGGDIQLFAMLIGDSGFLSNQFLSPAGSSDGNYGGGSVDFSQAAPDPVTVVAGVLPVELTSFVGSASGSRALLRWATASETGNDGFEVQMRSGGTFVPLAFVEGAGTTLEARSYAFITSELAPGTYAFRLRQLDLDGAENLSGVVEVTITAEGASLAMSGPNPFASSTSLTLGVDRAQHVTASLYNLLGRRVAMLHDGAVGERVTLSVDGGALTPGLYVVRVEGETFRATQALTLAR